MRTKHTLLLFFFFPLLLNAQAPNWLWEKTQGGNDQDRGLNVAMDASGNVYVTGEFRSPTITFGSFTLTNADNTSTTADIFIAKYDASGNVLWAKSAGGTSSDYGYGISNDANGNVYVTGAFLSSTITFGSTVLNNSSVNYDDGFIVKYDASGNVLWVKQETGIGHELGLSISIDNSGNVLTTGVFTSPTITFGTTILANSGSENIFIVKYDALGNVLWAKHAGGSGGDEVKSISTDANGNVLLTGMFTSPFIYFGSTTLTNMGYEDVFIVKYDASGNVLWAKSAGGTSNDCAQCIHADANGNVFVTGWFYSTAIPFGSTTLSTAGNEDIFIAKYDAYGNALWAKSAGGIGTDQGLGISVDASGNAFLTGVFRSTSISFGTCVLNCVGGGNVFVVKLDNSGNALWAKSSVGGYAVGNGISANNGNVVIAGLYSTTAIFDSDTLLSAGNDDIFVAKLNGIMGIAEENAYSPITVFPNPFSSETTLQLNQDLKNATLIIYNSIGQKVNEIASITMDAGQTIELQRNDIPTGVYFIQLSQDDKIIATKKLVANGN